VQKTMSIAVVPLADPWAMRELTICTRKLDELPLYARQLVEHLRSNKLIAGSAPNNPDRG
jgi:hypothetical protein